MRVPNLQSIKESEVVISVDIKDLLAAGLAVNEDFEITEKFCFHPNLKLGKDEIFDLHIMRSNGWFGSLEFHFAFFLESAERDENIHIAQEVSITQDEKGQFQFICPILGDSKYCTKLHLRNDFPLFASKEALGIR